MINKDYALPSIGRVSSKNIVKHRGVDSSSSRQREKNNILKFSYGRDPYTNSNFKID